MTADELKAILDKHAKWLRGEEGGSRADLAGEMGETVEERECDASWRDKRLAKVCGDKKLVVCIRPSGEPGWLYLDRVEDIVDYLIEGEVGEEWEMKWTLMTQAEIDAMPEHPGW